MATVVGIPVTFLGIPLILVPEYSADDEFSQEYSTVEDDFHTYAEEDFEAESDEVFFVHWFHGYPFGVYRESEEDPAEYSEGWFTASDEGFAEMWINEHGSIQYTYDDDGMDEGLPYFARFHPNMTTQSSYGYEESRETQEDPYDDGHGDSVSGAGEGWFRASDEGFAEMWIDEHGSIQYTYDDDGMDEGLLYFARFHPRTTWSTQSSDGSEESGGKQEDAYDDGHGHGHGDEGKGEHYEGHDDGHDGDVDDGDDDDGDDDDDDAYVEPYVVYGDESYQVEETDGDEQQVYGMEHRDDEEEQKIECRQQEQEEEESDDGDGDGDVDDDGHGHGHGDAHGHGHEAKLYVDNDGKDEFQKVYDEHKDVLLDHVLRGYVFVESEGPNDRPGALTVHRKLKSNGDNDDDNDDVNDVNDDDNGGHHYHQIEEEEDSYVLVSIYNEVVTTFST